MITEIEPNKSALNARIFGQVILLLALIYPIYLIITASSNPNRLVFIGWCCLFAFLSLNISFFLQLYFMPFWVTIDDELKTLEIKYLMLSTKLVKIDDIEGYSTITIRPNKDGSFGMVLYLSSGKKVLISDINFYDYTPIQWFLDSLNVKKNGEEDFSFISYFMGQ